MNNIFIATSTFCQYSKFPLNELDNNNILYSINDKGRKLTSSEMFDIIPSCNGIIAGTEKYDKKILTQAKNLRVISRLGVGNDNIDISIAERNKIHIYNTKTSPGLAVSELTLALILDLIRHVSKHNKDMKNGLWEKRMGLLLSGKTLGIVGFGKIGQSLYNITKGFDLKYLINDISIDSIYNSDDNVEYCSIEKLFSESDIISLHLNLSDQNYHLVNYNLLKQVKSNAIIINTSRGEIINENDLIKALDNQLISGVGLDVFESEPYVGRLSDYENVILTPHIAGYAKEIRIKMELEATMNLIGALENI